MMSQSIESQLSAEDLQLLDANSLGSPLGVSRLKSGYIRFFRWSGQFMFILGILIFILMIADWFRYQQDGSPEPFLESPP